MVQNEVALPLVSGLSFIFSLFFTHIHVFSLFFDQFSKRHHFCCEFIFCRFSGLPVALLHLIRRFSLSLSLSLSLSFSLHLPYSYDILRSRSLSLSLLKSISFLIFFFRFTKSCFGFGSILPLPLPLPPPHQWCGGLLEVILFSFFLSFFSSLFNFVSLPPVRSSH